MEPFQPFQPPVSDKNTFFKPFNPKKNKYSLVITIVVVVITLITVAALLSYLVLNNEDTSMNAVSTIREEVAIVTISDSGVNPSTIEVQSGQQVTFLNNSSISHRLFADPEYLSEFDSIETLSTGSSYTYVFDTPGIYNYYDPINDTKVRGTVVVK